MDLPASDRISVPRPTQVPDPSRSTVTYGTLTLCGPSLQNGSVNTPVSHSSPCGGPVLQPPGEPGFGLFRVRSPLLAEAFLFLGVLRCFSSPGCLRPSYEFSRTIRRVHRLGFPHSEICGLAPADGSPQLIAACHVLLRPLAPRHPPYALGSLFSGSEFPDPL